MVANLRTSHKDRNEKDDRRPSVAVCECGWFSFFCLFCGIVLLCFLLDVRSAHGSVFSQYILSFTIYFSFLPYVSRDAVMLITEYFE